MANDNSREDVGSLSLTSRIPLFWRDKPRLWIAQFETMVVSSKLSDENKFGLVRATRLASSRGDNIAAANVPATAEDPAPRRRVRSKNRTDENGQTALHGAAMFGQMGCVRLLCAAMRARGAPLDARNAHGQSAARLAAAARRHDVAAHLARCSAALPAHAHAHGSSAP
ncbi:hypothetical protein ACJJTC_015645 [Scirpophaga incertulas]